MQVLRTSALKFIFRILHIVPLVTLAGKIINDYIFSSSNHILSSNQPRFYMIMGILLIISVPHHEVQLLLLTSSPKNPHHWLQSPKQNIIRIIDHRHKFYPCGQYLNNIVGLSCPFEIQLVNSSKEKDILFEFEGRKGQKIRDGKEVAKIIRQESIRLNTQGVRISSRILKVKVYSSYLSSMRIILIPGYNNQKFISPQNETAIATRNEAINKLILSYIQQQFIMISVCKATQNLKNLDADKIIEKVDSSGVRSIQVLVGVDQIDENGEYIENQEIHRRPYDFGYIPVLLKQSQMSVQKHIQTQKQYFSSHPIYSKHHSICGFPFFLSIFTSSILKHYKSIIPYLRQLLLSQLQQCNQQYLSYGQYQSIETSKNQQLLLLHLISTFSRNYSQLLLGKSCDTEQLQGGARIQYIFNTIFTQSIMKMDPFEYLSNDDIRTAVSNANGLKKSLFINEMAFENLIKQQIGRLLLPSVECSRIIFEELKVFVIRIGSKELDRWKILDRRIKKVVNKILEECLMKTEKMIESIIEVEMGHINTNHPDFIREVDRNTKSTHSSNKSQEQIEVNITKERPKLEEQSMRKNEIDHINHKLERSSVKELEIERIQTMSHHSVRSPRPLLLPLLTSFPRLHLPMIPTIVTVSPIIRARQITQINLIKKFLLSYFNVIKKNISDSIPKTIVTFLVNRSRDMCEKTLINELYSRKEGLEELFVESEGVRRRRGELRERMGVIRKCLGELGVEW